MTEAKEPEVISTDKDNRERWQVQMVMNTRRVHLADRAKGTILLLPPAAEVITKENLARQFEEIVKAGIQNGAIPRGENVWWCPICALLRRWLVREVLVYLTRFASAHAQAVVSSGKSFTSSSGVPGGMGFTISTLPVFGLWLM